MTSSYSAPRPVNVSKESAVHPRAHPLICTFTSSGNQSNGIVHTHSTYGTSFAQAAIDPMFPGPPGRQLLRRDPGDETDEPARNRGRLRIEQREGDRRTFSRQPSQSGSSSWRRLWEATRRSPGDRRRRRPLKMRSCSSSRRGWLLGLSISPDMKLIPQYLLDEHFLRKHGPGGMCRTTRWPRSSIERGRRHLRYGRRAGSH